MDRSKRKVETEDLEEQLEEEEAARQKLQLEKVQCDARIKKMEEDTNVKLGKEKKVLDERVADLVQTLAEATIAELGEKILKDHQQRQEMDRSKRKVETEVNDLKEQLNERKLQIELQLHLGKCEELAQAQMRVDEEGASNAEMQKVLRKLQEDLEAERSARLKAEEELALKNELLDSLDTTAAMQESKRKQVRGQGSQYSQTQSYPPYPYSSGQQPHQVGFNPNPPYPTGTSSYVPQPFSVPSQPSAYPSVPSYPTQSTPYPPQSSSYPSQSSPYPIQSPYSSQAPYPSSQAGYPQGSGFPPSQGGYPPQGSGYPSQNPSYGTSQPPYPPSPFPQKPSPNYPGSTVPSSYPSHSQPQSHYPTQPSSQSSHYAQQPGNNFGSMHLAGSSVHQKSGSNFQGNPTVRPAVPFDPRQDAEILRKAMKGFGTDEKAIINVLTKRSNAQRLEIAVQFKALYGKLLLLFCYEGYYKSLEKELEADTSGYFRRLLISLCQGRRQENPVIDNGVAFQDAQALMKAGELRIGTDESVFNAILVTRSYPQLAHTFSEYQRLSGRPFEQAVRSEFSGDIETGLLAIVKTVEDRPGFFAERLRNSMVGIETNDRDLIRIIVSHCEIDLADIKRAYQARYGKSLEAAIEGDTSGDYKKTLVALVSG